MTEDNLDLNVRRKDQALQVFEKYPEMIAPAMQTLVLEGKVVIGMTPYEAHLAAGSFAFKVIADPSKWERNVDPYKVMWAQSTIPDNSKIWMTFENDTQFPSEGKQSFRVYFEGGKATEITKLTQSI